MCNRGCNGQTLSQRGNLITIRVHCEESACVRPRRRARACDGVVSCYLRETPGGLQVSRLRCPRSRSRTRKTFSLAASRFIRPPPPPPPLPLSLSPCPALALLTHFLVGMRHWRCAVTQEKEMKAWGYLRWLQHAYLLSHSHTMLLGPLLA
jgi:hypothetical protein